MPCGPYWQAMCLVSAVSPPLAAEYAPPRSPPTTANVDVMLMIAEPGLHVRDHVTRQPERRSKHQTQEIVQ